MIVDLKFDIAGKRFPCDHGYKLYAALCARMPELKAASFALLPVRGVKTQGRSNLQLTPRSRLGVRTDTDTAAQIAFHFMNSALRIGDNTFRLGEATAYPLVPGTRHRAQMVTVRNHEHDTPAEFEQHLRSRLLDCGLDVGVTAQKATYMHIHKHPVTGYTCLFDSDINTSVALQECGVGGRRKMGCGVIELSLEG